LNQAIDWAVAATENADHYRQKARTVNVTVDSSVTAEQAARIALMTSPFASGGVVRRPVPAPLMGEQGTEAILPTADKTLKNAAWQCQDFADRAPPLGSDAPPPPAPPRPPAERIVGTHGSDE
jgi:hypothetical protein